MKTQTDNSNIVVESLDEAAIKYADNFYDPKDYKDASACTYADLHKNTMVDFKKGANWKEEQLQPLIDSHKELHDIVKGLCVIFYKELQTKKMPDEKTDMYPIIKSAIEKANKLIQ